jgi:hypothetical protein
MTDSSDLRRRAEELLGAIYGAGATFRAGQWESIE